MKKIVYLLLVLALLATFVVADEKTQSDNVQSATKPTIDTKNDIKLIKRKIKELRNLLDKKMRENDEEAKTLIWDYLRDMSNRYRITVGFSDGKNKNTWPSLLSHKGKRPSRRRWRSTLNKKRVPKFKKLRLSAVEEENTLRYRKDKKKRRGAKASTMRYFVRPTPKLRNARTLRYRKPPRRRRHEKRDGASTLYIYPPRWPAAKYR